MTPEEMRARLDQQQLQHWQREERELRHKLRVSWLARQTTTQTPTPPVSFLHRSQYARGVSDYDRAILKARGIAPDA